MQLSLVFVVDIAVSQTEKEKKGDHLVAFGIHLLSNQNTHFARTDAV